MNHYLNARAYVRSSLQWAFRPPRLQLVRRVVGIGSDYGGYFLDPSLLPTQPVIYSLGIGKDISFDLALIEQFGFTVHGFDPTPEVKTWLESKALPPQFRFHAIGIAELDGEAAFYLPPRPDFISHSVVRARQYSQDSIRVPVIKLSTAIRTLGHQRIDVLKMDIEGAEYAVLADLIKDKIEVGQILVEFHHRLSSVGVNKTREAISALNAYGMKICHICPRKEVMTLIAA